MIKRQGTVTVGDAFKMFKASKVSMCEKTVHNYEQSFSFFLSDNEIDDDFPTKSITSTLICNWVNGMKERGLKTASINHYLGDVRVFMYWCMRENYTNSFKITLVKGQETMPKFYTEEEIEILLQK